MKLPIRVPLASVVAAIGAIREQAPPTVDLDRALQAIGPDMRRMLRDGWGDRDLIDALLEADVIQTATMPGEESAKPRLHLSRDELVALLRHHRDKEAAAKRKRRRAGAHSPPRSGQTAASSPLPRIATSRPPALSSPNRSNKPPLLPGDGGSRGTPLALPGPDTAPDRNPGVD